jgi:GAF domain-containing protein
MSREAWTQLLRRKADFGYICTVEEQKAGDRRAITTFDSDNSTEPSLIPISGQWDPEMIKAGLLGQTLRVNEKTIAVPIKIREQIAGVVKLKKPEFASNWTDNEIALMETLSDQLSVALESARLYEETQRRAERERLAGEITARMRASNDPQVILKTAVRELRRALQTQRAQILIQTAQASDQTDSLQEQDPTQEPQESKADSSGQLQRPASATDTTGSTE